MRVDLETVAAHTSAKDKLDLLAELTETLDRIKTTRLLLLAAWELRRPAIPTPRWFPR
jgi:hypothetical protein